MMQTEAQQLTLQSDKDTRERIITALALSGYPAVRSMLFKIEQGIVDILGRFPSFYLCQVAIESVKRVPGVIRVRNHSQVIYALSPQVNIESDADADSRLRSLVKIPAAEVASSLFSRSVAFRSDDESERYAGAANHD